MEKDRKTKMLIIIGLLAIVITLSVGFAAFTQSLSISSNAIVNPESTTLDILFSSSTATQATQGIIATPSDANVTRGTATIINDGTYPTITGLNVPANTPISIVYDTSITTNQGNQAVTINKETINVTFAN